MYTHTTISIYSISHFDYELYFIIYLANNLILKHWVIEPLHDAPGEGTIKRVALAAITKGLFATDHRGSFLEALRSEDIEVGAANLIRNDGVGPLQAPEKVPVTLAMRTRVEAVVDQVVALLPGSNEERALVVDFAAKVSHVEDAQVHLLVHCCGAVSAPVGTREDRCGAVGQSSATIWTGKWEIYINA